MMANCSAQLSVVVHTALEFHEQHDFGAPA